MQWTKAAARTAKALHLIISHKKNDNKKTKAEVHCLHVCVIAVVRDSRCARGRNACGTSNDISTRCLLSLFCLCLAYFLLPETEVVHFLELFLVYFIGEMHIGFLSKEALSLCRGN